MNGDLDVDMSRGDHFNPSFYLGRLKDDEFESRSLSDDDSFDAMSGDENKQEQRPKRKKKKRTRYHRHTSYQIQELESFFKVCPHPNEKQRLELGKKLTLEGKQIKFWFQNRRTQMKTQLERHENVILRQENEKLRLENSFLKESMRGSLCIDCGGAVIPGEVSFEQHQLRIENTKLKDELDRICALANRFIGGSISLEQPLNGGIGSEHLPIGNGFSGGTSLMFMDLAMEAMNELLKLAELENPLWRSKSEKESIVRPACTRETGLVLINSVALVDALMDTNKWAEMFECFVAVASTVEVISNGSDGSRNGSLQLMQAEFQVMSPLVPIRQKKFLRYCKQHGDGLWAVVDVSYDINRENENLKSYGGSKRFPSGCIIQNIDNGCSKVTWIEHSEYGESHIHSLYQPLLGSSVGLGATKWLATLQRQCESFTNLLSSQDHTGLSLTGTKSILKLAQRMKVNFYSGITASSVHKWEKLNAENVGQDTRILTRKSLEPSGIVLSAATSLWLPVTQQRLFEFLCDGKCRNQWDILSNGASMETTLLVPKGQHEGSCVSLLRAAGKDQNESSMLILQETWNDASGAMVVYAPVDIPSMNVVMSGGDSVYVALLPSGFSIFPDGSSSLSDQIDTNGGLVNQESKGCLLTVGFQILVNSLPTAKLNVESVETVNNLIACTIHKIRAALRIPA
ncbi:PREDICTED: homeobox-leucine zipper protein HDG7 isoform X2 [Camelina sativa]|uniref:Homeobox-leucine zipper protein HDG7 isoform X2 n=1 Tax=Camelina sativa TaxID=90675 RepID=A0ABM1R8P9_CAMSA|nr:PREDICTED: homeobox-leucine zipper protein HDG7 isoform X2 [Camelina sativa]